MTAGVGLRFDATGGSANGAAADVSWHSWLPHGRVRWLVTDKARTAIYGGYTRSADRLLSRAGVTAIGGANRAGLPGGTPRCLRGGFGPVVPPGPRRSRRRNPAFSGIDSDLRPDRRTHRRMESYLSSDPVAAHWNRTMGAERPALQNVGVNLQDYLHSPSSIPVAASASAARRIPFPFMTGCPRASDVTVTC